MLQLLCEIYSDIIIIYICILQFFCEIYSNYFVHVFIHI